MVSSIIKNNMEWSFYVDKERYTKELKELTRSNKTLTKPKKPLTPYMLFVREVSNYTLFNIEFLMNYI